MPWYKSGTVSVTQNSNAVIGIGTAFIANSRVGDGFRGPDGGWYEVTNIASDTALAIDPPYQGATNVAGSYALAPLQGYVKDSADALRALVNQFGGVLAVLGDNPTQTGVREALNLTDADGIPDGETNKYLTNARVLSSVLTGLNLAETGAVVSTDNIIVAFSKLQAGKAAKGVNSDITELNGLTKPITPSQGGVSDGYIDGLIPTWNSGSSITISAGAAYIQSTGKVLRSSSPITITGLSGLTADIFYYFYLYDNAGAAAIEVVSTATAAPYYGSARSKNGDSSRRFICALRSGAGTTLYRFQWCADQLIRYITTTNTAPFRAVTNATNTTKTLVNIQTLVPANTATALLAVINAAGSGPILQVSHPDANDTDILFGVAPNNRFPCVVPLDSLRRFAFYNSASGGGAFFDVCGYGTDR